MANRVVLDATHGFKVSKAGQNVLTATPQNLLVGGAFETLGVYATGIINPAAGYNITYNTGISGQTMTMFRSTLPNPLGTIPLVMCQEIVSSTQARSVHRNSNFQLMRELADESIPTYITYINGVDETFTYNVTLNTLEFRSLSGLSVRYAAFYSTAGYNVHAAADITPNAIAWANVSGTSATMSSSTQTVSGLGTGVSIVLRVNCDITGIAGNAYRFQVITSGSAGGNNTIGYGTFTLQAGKNDVYVEVKNGDTVRFVFSTTDSVDRTATISVYNASTAPEVLLDTLTMRPNYFDRVPNALDWTNVTGDQVAQTNSQTVTGINTPITLRVDFSPAYTGFIGVNTASPTTSVSAATTNAFTAAAYNNQTIYWSFAPSATYSGTVTIRNASSSNTSLDTFTVNITAAPPQIRGDWGSIVQTVYTSTIGETGYLSAYSDTVTIAGLSTSHTMTVTLSMNPPPGGFRMYLKRGAGAWTAVITMTGTVKTGSYSVQNGDQIYFNAARTGSNFYSYFANATVTDTTRGVTVDTIPISLMQEVMGV